MEGRNNSAAALGVLILLGLVAAGVAIISIIIGRRQETATSPVYTQADLPLGSVVDGVKITIRQTAGILRTFAHCFFREVPAKKASLKI